MIRVPIHKFNRITKTMYRAEWCTHWLGTAVNSPGLKCFSLAELLRKRCVFQSIWVYVIISLTWTTGCHYLTNNRSTPLNDEITSNMHSLHCILTGPLRPLGSWRQARHSIRVIDIAWCPFTISQSISVKKVHVTSAFTLLRNSSSTRADGCSCCRFGLDPFYCSCTRSKIKHWFPSGQISYEKHDDRIW